MSKRRGITGLASSLSFLTSLLPQMLLAIATTSIAHVSAGADHLEVPLWRDPAQPPKRTKMVMSQNPRVTCRPRFCRRRYPGFTRYLILTLGRKSEKLLLQVGAQSCGGLHVSISDRSGCAQHQSGCFAVGKCADSWHWAGLSDGHRHPA